MPQGRLLSRHIGHFFAYAKNPVNYTLLNQFSTQQKLKAALLKITSCFIDWQYYHNIIFFPDGHNRTRRISYFGEISDNRYKACHNGDSRRNCNSGRFFRRSDTSRCLYRLLVTKSSSIPNRRQNRPHHIAPCKGNRRGSRKIFHKPGRCPPSGQC